MEELDDIIGAADPSEAIKILKSHRGSPKPDIQEAEKHLDPKNHEINNKAIRPDKHVNGVDSEGTKYTRREKVARIAIPLQKSIINKAASFLFGTPVVYNATPENEGEEVVYKAIERILKENKINSKDRKIARTVFAYKECAELWYVADTTPNERYGFASDKKVRCAILSPENGDELYPYFDEYGDMKAFSRSYSINDGKAKTLYFETYTDNYIYRWSNSGNGYELVEGYPMENPIHKIPVVYGSQDHFETEDVDILIERLEKLLSNFADTNDYHASPKIFTTGVITGFSAKGESGSVIEGEEGATMQYVSWAQAPESVKLEVETLLKMIYSISQTPDISFESVKGIGAISGTALKLLFMDAHLKVQDKKEVFDEYLQRRVNIIKAFISTMNNSLSKSCDGIEVEPEITPYILTNEIEDINMWLAANGNKPLVSQKASVKGANLTQDPDRDFEQIQEESASDNSFAFGEPTLDA